MKRLYCFQELLQKLFRYRLGFVGELYPKELD